ncbi:photosystem II 5 kDa protein, chloroplastic-like [Zingiber officinale]|uniref:photosystem II 5 kDa protein, chloroplastic-like n=1 Tax=Zingiber officinale TaxID=94328 RepID=UPI001C4BE28C|nr:photosystem II 5 kDa protein, chloroplastic-like [Zingiber officinale]
MASLTMMASILGGAATVAGRPSLNSGRRSLIVAKAAAPKDHDQAASSKPDDENAGGRRAVMFAAAAAAACAVGQGIAMALDEPKRGTPEAKKKYGPVCVTMPTAKICHK